MHKILIQIINQIIEKHLVRMVIYLCYHHKVPVVHLFQQLFKKYQSEWKLYIISLFNMHLKDDMNSTITM
jgi:hypothetical protein